MGDLDETKVLYSEAWWETRTSGQLRELIERGLAGGEAFDGAVREMERRDREARRRQEAAEADMRRRGSIALWAAIASLLVAIAAFVKVSLNH